jgi:5-methylcytosine-specific restriction endonuclease McrA
MESMPALLYYVVLGRCVCLEVATSCLGQWAAQREGGSSTGLGCKAKEKDVLAEESRPKIRHKIFKIDHQQVFPKETEQ